MKRVKLNLILWFLLVFVFGWTMILVPNLIAREKQPNNQRETLPLLRHKRLPKPGLLPTSPFYFLKRLEEDIVTFFTFGEANKAIRYFEMATRRLAEAEELVAQGKLDQASTAFKDYEKALEKTKSQVIKAQLRGVDLSKLAEKILTVLPEEEKVENQKEIGLPSPLLKKAQENAEKELATPNGVEEALKVAALKILAKNQTQSSPASPSTLSQGSDKFGFCDGFGNRRSDDIFLDIQDTKALGFLWGRPLGDVFAQETVEKNGVYDFSVPDKVVKEMQSSGIKIFGTLFPTGISKIPDSIDAISFSKYVKAIVDHYKGQIAYWQVGIEPFCQTKSERCFKNFFELAKTAYEAAKSVDPSIKISPGGPAPIYDIDRKIDPMGEAIFGYFFKNGGINYMDFFNFHYLVGREAPSIAKYVGYWKQYVGEKEIWLSETGSRDVGDRYRVSSDEEKEAEWVKKHIDEAFQSGISKIFWCRAEHSFSDMPKVVEALQKAAKQYGGIPSGTVAKRQTREKMPEIKQPQPAGEGQKNHQFMPPNQKNQQQFQQFPQKQSQPFDVNKKQPSVKGGYCGDSQCDLIEQQTGGCPQDCQ